MGMSKHPSVKPSPPRKPPVVTGGGKRESGEAAPYGARNLFSHSSEHHTHPETYGTKGMSVGHAGGDKGEFAHSKEGGMGGSSGFPKAGTKSGAGY